MRDTHDGEPTRARRRWFALGAVGATTVAVVFATVGDGVDETADGIRGVLLDHGHTAVWVLLAVALAAAAAAGHWTRAAGGVATAALVLYVAFLAALLTAG